MPLYEYKCSKCNEVFEVLQRFSDAPVKVHDGCGGKVARLLTAPTFQFKGSGFYITDYANKHSSSPSSESNGSNGSESSNGKEGSHKDASHKETSGKETSGKETSGKDAGSKSSNPAPSTTPAPASKPSPAASSSDK